MTSPQEKIPGGFYIKARCIQESDISQAPPHIREIWDWFLMNANHKDRGKIKRGQLFTSYNNILNGLCWYVGYRKCSYTKAQCETAMKYLTSRTMIATARTTRGMIVTVLNYDKFQDVKNYENHNETEMKPTREPHESRHDTQECKKEKRKENIKKKNPIFETYDFPPWVDKPLFLEFCRNRHLKVKNGKIESERAMVGLINKLEKLIEAGHSQDDIITEAITGNWKSFYEPKNPTQPKNLQPQTYAQVQDLERRQQVAAIRRYEDERKQRNNQRGTGETKPRIECQEIDGRIKAVN